MPESKPERNREAITVFSRLSSLMAADKPCPKLQPSLTKRTMTTTDGDSLKSIKIRENGADEEIEHEVVLRMDPEGFDFETRPKSTEASLV